eukprot:gene13643-21263_t
MLRGDPGGHLVEGIVKEHRAMLDDERTQRLGQY